MFRMHQSAIRFPWIIMKINMGPHRNSSVKVGKQNITRCIQIIKTNMAKGSVNKSIDKKDIIEEQEGQFYGKYQGMGVV